MALSVDFHHVADNDEWRKVHVSVAELQLAVLAVARCATDAVFLRAIARLRGRVARAGEPRNEFFEARRAASPGGSQLTGS